jgi:hypothetical protein
LSFPKAVLPNSTQLSNPIQVRPILSPCINPLRPNISKAITPKGHRHIGTGGAILVSGTLRAPENAPAVTRFVQFVQGEVIESNKAMAATMDRRRANDGLRE